MRVGEAGQHAASAEVDRLGARQRGLVHADAARDPLARDPERRDGRQRRVERADRPVAEDHGAEPSLGSRAVRPLRAGPRPAAAKLRRDDHDERHAEDDDCHRDHLRQLAREAQRRVEVDRERLARPDEERRDRVLVEGGRERDQERGDDRGQDQRERHPPERRERAGPEVIGRLAERSVDLLEPRQEDEDRVREADHDVADPTVRIEGAIPSSWKSSNSEIPSTTQRDHERAEQESRHEPAGRGSGAARARWPRGSRATTAPTLERAATIALVLEGRPHVCRS